MITRQEITAEMTRVISGRRSECVLDMAEALEADGYTAEEIQDAVTFAYSVPLGVGIKVRKLPPERVVPLERGA